MNVFSYGGGVQSTAALVLAAQGKLAVDYFLFANVGDDSESKDTLRYLREYAVPYAWENGLPLIQLWRVKRTGERETLYQRVASGKRGIVIPAKIASGGPMRRQCTYDFKILVVNKWLREHGATKSRPATVMLGISLDEYQRMRTGDELAYARRAYPLIDMRITRSDCHEIIRAAGLPTPPKSSCFFCPYHSFRVWRELHDSRPEDFARAVDMERGLTAWSARRGHGPIYLAKAGRSLDKLFSDERQLDLFPDNEDDACESGYCMV